MHIANMNKTKNNECYALKCVLIDGAFSGQHTVEGKVLTVPNGNFVIRVTVNGELVDSSEEINGYDGKLAYMRAKAAVRRQFQRLLEAEWPESYAN
jgi:hypothetical protein